MAPTVPLGGVVGERAARRDGVAPREDASKMPADRFGSPAGQPAASRAARRLRGIDGVASDFLTRHGARGAARRAAKRRSRGGSARGGLAAAPCAPARSARRDEARGRGRRARAARGLAGRRGRPAARPGRAKRRPGAGPGARSAFSRRRGGPARRLGRGLLVRRLDRQRRPRDRAKNVRYDSECGLQLNLRCWRCWGQPWTGLPSIAAPQRREKPS